ncbi:MAG TPA: hypothetical protein VLA83_10595, partial [Candidatus Binatia bacterium]|nr:hypothetical protein [Candidatus Binatia bacterium]
VVVVLAAVVAREVAAIGVLVAAVAAEIAATASQSQQKMKIKRAGQRPALSYFGPANYRIRCVP